METGVVPSPTGLCPRKLESLRSCVPGVLFLVAKLVSSTSVVRETPWPFKGGETRRSRYSTPMTLREEKVGKTRTFPAVETPGDSGHPTVRLGRVGQRGRKGTDEGLRTFGRVEFPSGTRPGRNLSIPHYGSSCRGPKQCSRTVYVRHSKVSPFCGTRVLV